jgi:hypothetical protein
VYDIAHLAIATIQSAISADGAWVQAATLQESMAAIKHLHILVAGHHRGEEEFGARLQSIITDVELMLSLLALD